MAKEAQLTDKFRGRVTRTGMTHTAIAEAIGVTRQFFSAVWLGKEQPTVRFAVGAIRAGLGEGFDDIITITNQDQEKAS